MNQEITVSESVVEFLYSLFENREFDVYSRTVHNIESNVNTGDTGYQHFRNWYTQLESLPDNSFRKVIQEFVERVTSTSKSQIRTVDIEKSVDSIAMAIAERTADKIYFDPAITEHQLSQKKESAVEIYDARSFLEPTAFQRLKHCPTELYLSHGMTYDLEVILKPFLKYSRNIVITDPYLPNPKARVNLRKIFRMNSTARYELQTLSRKEYCCFNSRKQPVYTGFLNELNKFGEQGLKVAVTEIRKKHWDRYIFTDEFEIYIPGGLDFLDDKGRYQGEYASLRVEYRNKQTPLS
ncbi:MAG: hypothetical protein ACM3SM_03960 [Bacteroidota bacterium]